MPDGFDVDLAVQIIQVLTSSATHRINFALGPIQVNAAGFIRVMGEINRWLAFGEGIGAEVGPLGDGEKAAFIPSTKMFRFVDVDPASNPVGRMDIVHESVPITEDQRAIWNECTGRHSLPSKPRKSFVMALLGVYLACFRNYQQYLGPSEKATIMIVAADRKQAKIVLRFVKGLLKVPVLAARVQSDRVDGVDLEGDTVIEVITAGHAVRGYNVAACLVDELAFFPADDASVSGAEVVAAIRPAMLTIPGSILVCASSPYARRGPLWEAYRRHFGKDDSQVLVWRAPTLVMNPSVPRKIIDEAFEADPLSAAAECGAEFRSDVAAFIGREQVDACVSLGFRERPPVAGTRYFGFVDSSGGSADAMTLAISHREKNGDIVCIDAIREVRPPFSPNSVVEEFAHLLKTYGVAKCVGDHYAGLCGPRSAFRFTA
jgi:hypothetical protein